MIIREQVDRIRVDHGNERLNEYYSKGYKGDASIDYKGDYTTDEWCLHNMPLALVRRLCMNRYRYFYVPDLKDTIMRRTCEKMNAPNRFILARMLMSDEETDALTYLKGWIDAARVKFIEFMMDRCQHEGVPRMDGVLMPKDYETPLDVLNEELTKVMGIDLGLQCDELIPNDIPEPYADTDDEGQYLDANEVSAFSSASEDCFKEKYKINWLFPVSEYVSDSDSESDVKECIEKKGLKHFLEDIQFRKGSVMPCSSLHRKYKGWLQDMGLVAKRGTIHELKTTIAEMGVRVVNKRRRREMQIKCYQWK